MRDTSRESFYLGHAVLCAVGRDMASLVVCRFCRVIVYRASSSRVHISCYQATRETMSVNLRNLLRYRLAHLHLGIVYLRSF